ncbi:MAG: hypothetical protein IJQ65_05315, partial [Kiritimatiellae bacterium]|nr:hypothetical protein [Kiritimatiellia bacterium]
MEITITNDIRYIGVDDHDIDLFEGLYDVPNGMAYNSYVILDEKIAVMDTVEARFGKEWLGKLDAALAGRTPDYLVVHHVEPDHSANITAFMKKYPEAKIVASAQAFKLIANFYGTDYADRRIVAAEGAGVFYIFDCLTDLQKYWFSDMMVCNFFCLTCPFLQEQQSIAYVPILYEKHIYETVSRIRHAAPVLLNIRTMNAATYIHAVKVDGRQTEYMYFPIKIDGANSTLVTSSAESYGIFDIFTQTGERRDCWDSMFDFADDDESEPTDPDALAHRDNIIRCLLGNEPQRFALCRKYFTTADLIAIKKREIGTGCIGGKAVGMLLARRVLRATDPELFARRIEPHDSYFIGADVFYTYFVQNDAWSLRTKMVDVEDYLAVAPQIREKLLHGEFMPTIKEQFLSMLEYFGQSPIIVRSSSILEDGFGNAFAGKYDSVFCPNQGTPEERYAEFEAAVRTVYASTVNEDAIRYRADRDLLSRDEQMALLVMRVSGDIHGDYYFPHIAGVGHSQNLYVTSAAAAEENRGALRLVMGMGTRAVDR